MSKKAIVKSEKSYDQIDWLKTYFAYRFSKPFWAAYFPVEEYDKYRQMCIGLPNSLVHGKFDPEIWDSYYKKTKK